jgi:hypothetical protein
MIFGMTTLTFVHVVLSVIGILSGFVVVFGLLTVKRLDAWTALFLASTVATSVTGFLFPFYRFLPSHGAGVISLVALAVAIFARYPRHLGGAWGRIYAINAVIALYLNFFIFVVQSFQKVPGLKAVAPTQSSISGHATRCSGTFGRPCNWGCDQVPQRAGPHNLIGQDERYRREY